MMIIGTIVTNWLVLLINLATSILAARLLGVEGRGQLALVLLYPQMIATMGMLGLDRGLAIVGGRKELNSPALAPIVILTVVFSFPVMVLAYFVVINRIVEPTLAKLSLLYILYIPALYFFMLSISLFNGVGDFIKYNASRLSFYGSYLFLILVFWTYRSLMLNNFVYANLLSVYAAMLVTGFFLFRVKIHDRLYSLKIIFSDCLVILKKTALFVIPGILAVAATRLDQIILSSYLDVKYLGLFVVYLAFSQMIAPVANAINVNVFHLSIMESKRNIGQLTRIATVTYIICLSLMFLMAPLLIRLLYGETYMEHLSSARLLLLSSFFFFISQIFNEHMKGRSKVRQDIISLTVFMISMACTAYWLLPIFSIVGMAFSMVIANALRFLYLMMIFRREMNMKISDLLFIKQKDLFWMFQTGQKMMRGWL